MIYFYGSTKANVKPVRPHATNGEVFFFVGGADTLNLPFSANSVGPKMTFKAIIIPGFRIFSSETDTWLVPIPFSTSLFTMPAYTTDRKQIIFKLRRLMYKVCVLCRLISRGGLKSGKARAESLTPAMAAGVTPNSGKCLIR